MVTDAQYKELLERVVALEKKMGAMSLQISRLVFKDAASSQTHETITATAKKDKTKYIFEGKQYCKRRLAYVCVKKYIVENQISTYSEVIDVFPNYLQGSLGVIQPVELAEKYANAHRRFYFADEDILYLSGKPYVICSQWEKKNINNILTVANKLGYSVETI